jgi:hypothetical protein
VALALLLVTMPHLEARADQAPAMTRLTSRVRMLARYAWGSMALSLQVSISKEMAPQWTAPWSEPANSAFLRLTAIGRIERSTV